MGLQMINAGRQGESCRLKRCRKRVNALLMVCRDDADRSAEEPFEQFPYRSQPRTGCIRRLVEADQCVPARIERQIAARNEHS